MSLLEQASLVVTPNAYKESKLYSVVPNTTLGDMDVVRATTATRVNSLGLIENVGLNVPRLDYTNGSCPSLLVEPQRTNLLTYSEQFDNSWTKQAGTVVTANQIISPDGTQNADLVFGTGGGIYQSGKTVPTINTKSIYMKGVSGGEVVILQDPFETVNITVCNLTTNWQRFTLTETQSGGFGGLWVNQIPSGGIYIWGAQLELGSYATSYIPTVASTVTRNADVISKTGITSLIGQTEGTMFVDFYPTINSVTEVVTIQNAFFDNSIIIGTNYNLILIQIYNSGNFIQINGGAYINKNRYKVALSYKNNNTKLFVNGILKATNTENLIFNSTMNTLLNYGHANNYGSGLFEENSTQLYKTALSDQECINLTTL